MVDTAKRVSGESNGHESAGRASVVIGGVWGAGFGGNSTSSLVLQQAFQSAGFEVYCFGFRRDWFPGRPLSSDYGNYLELHTQSFTCHSEGVLHRRILKKWLHRVRPLAIWVLNSRHVSALPPGLPYIVWEATTWRDEMSGGDVGMSMQGRRAGAGRILHTMLRPLDRYSERQALHQAKIVAAMSRHTAKHIIAEKLAEAEKVCVLRHPPSNSFEELASAPDNTQVESDFISVARWGDPRKGAVLLEKAVGHLAARGEKYSWTIVGEEADRVVAALRSMGVKALAEVAPDDSSLINLLRRHRYLVIPAFQEGFGITGIEAFHCRVPVVTTDCGGPADYVEDGRTGFIGSTDVKGLGEALSRAGRQSKEDRERMAQAAWQVAKTSFSNKRFAADMLRLTRQVFELPQGITSPLYV